MFSSHNRDYQYFNKLPWQRKIEFNRRFLKFFLYCLYHLPTHFKMKGNEIYTDHYAVVNDGDHRFSMLVYYIGIEKQFEHRAAAGFSDAEAYNCQGKPVERDTLSHWIYYLARKN